MAAINTRISGLKPLVFCRRSALGLIVVCTIALTLAMIAMGTSQHSSAFAESQPASQPDTLQVDTDVQDVATDRGGEDLSPAMRESSGTDRVAAFEPNNLAVWLTTMAVGAKQRLIRHLPCIHIQPLSRAEHLDDSKFR